MQAYSPPHGYRQVGDLPARVDFAATVNLLMSMCAGQVSISDRRTRWQAPK